MFRHQQQQWDMTIAESFFLAAATARLALTSIGKSQTNTFLCHGSPTVHVDLANSSIDLAEA